MDRTIGLAAGSILIGVLVFALKYAAWHVTGSLALLSDALESLVNIAAAVAALVTVKLAARPADANHPYGHHKAEYLSAVLEGVLIVIAALVIFRESYYGYLDPEPIETPFRGLLLNGIASVVNAAWAWILIRHGRIRRSPALQADGRHILGDVFSSAAIFLGVLLVALTGWRILDPLLAALAGIYILWSGWRVVKASVGGLMDIAPPPDELEDIRAIISEHARGALEAHDLRARHAGRATFIEFHLIVPGDMTVTAAHGICDSIERALKDRIDHAVITIHVEPDEKAKHRGIVVL